MTYSAKSSFDQTDRMERKTVLAEFHSAYFEADSLVGLAAYFGSFVRKLQRPALLVSAADHDTRFGWKHQCLQWYQVTIEQK